MDHGDHWACLEADTDAILNRYVARVLTEGEASVGPSRPVPMQIAADGSRVAEPAELAAIGLSWEPGPFGCRALIVPAHAGDGGNVMASAYPYSLHERTVPLVVHGVQADETGLEGWVVAETLDGLPLNFLDIDFYRNAELYETGRTYRFRLGALAYALRREPPQNFELTDPEKLAVVHQAAGTVNDGSPLTLSTRGMAALVPVEREGWLPFEYRMHAPVRARQSIVAHGGSFQLLTVTVMRGDGDFDLELLAGTHIGGEGAPAQPGDDVGGHIWVHGRLADPQATD